MHTTLDLIQRGKKQYALVLPFFIPLYDQKEMNKLYRKQNLACSSRKYRSYEIVRGHVQNPILSVMRIYIWALNKINFIGIRITRLKEPPFPDQNPCICSFQFVSTVFLNIHPAFFDIRPDIRLKVLF